MTIHLRFLFFNLNLLTNHLESKLNCGSKTISERKVRRECHKLPTIYEHQIFILNKLLHWKFFKTIKVGCLKVSTCSHLPDICKTCLATILSKCLSYKKWNQICLVRNNQVVTWCWPFSKIFWLQEEGKHRRWKAILLMSVQNKQVAHGKNNHVYSHLMLTYIRSSKTILLQDEGNRRRWKLFLVMFAWKNRCLICKQPSSHLMLT